VNCFSGPDRPHGGEQLLLNAPVIRELILRHMDDHDSDAILGEVLLVLEASIDGDEYIKLLFRAFQQGSILQSVPSLFMYGRGRVMGKQAFDTRIYAFINEDAHSKS
jgi:hypothetical protein